MAGSVSKTIAFIGFGLIGGSIAKALRKKHPEYLLYAWNPHIEKVNTAIADGVLNYALSSLQAPELHDADIVLLCAPVESNCENLRAILPVLNENVIISDIGSVKTGIHEEASRLGVEDRFVGGHPMAGSERTGYLASKDYLLENAYYVITSSDKADPEKVQAMVDLAGDLGALPIRMDYREHDRVVAAVSHVPHVIAASLVRLVRDSDNPEQMMKTIAAGGFKDITRIASSSPEMWQQICMTNAGNITELLQKYIDALSDIKRIIDEHSSEDIKDFFSGAREYRESFIDASSGPIKRNYALSIDIADEPGVIASVSTMLAVHSLNIKNIGITHNREIERGALKIEFWSGEDMEAAKNILALHGYVICY
ncbi:MAG: prephenate dehydrogenase [Lachnospiraceae bacterium]|nr:prephenate dehydrogenase [Lachnospiraceae bacterium]